MKNTNTFAKSIVSFEPRFSDLKKPSIGCCLYNHYIVILCCIDAQIISQKENIYLTEMCERTRVQEKTVKLLFTQLSPNRIIQENHIIFCLLYHPYFLKIYKWANLYFIPPRQEIAEGHTEFTLSVYACVCLYVRKCVSESCPSHSFITHGGT